MNKKLLKPLAGLLAALMLLPMAVSCKEDDKGKEGENTAAGNNTVQTSSSDDTGKKKKTEAELPDVNYNGYVFSVKVRSDEVSKRDIWVESPNTDVNEAVWERTNYLKEKFGVELKIVSSTSTKDDGTDTSELSKIQSGACEMDLIATHGRSAMSYAINSCGYNWYNLPWVDLECDWWCQGAVKNWTIDGRIYCMIGDLSWMNVAQANAMYFNKSLLDHVEIEYPYQDAIDGKWTLARMKEIALDAYNGMEKTGTGLLADDSFAYTSGWWRGAVNLLYSTGHFVIQGNSADEFKLTCYNEIIQNAYTDYLDNFLFLGGNICNTEAPEDYGKMIKAFTNNRVVFYDDTLSRASGLKGTDFGILPFPKYSEDVEGYPTLVNAYSNVFVVPCTIADAERTGVILEAMSFYGYQNIVPVYYDEVLSSKVAPDVDSKEILQIIRQNFVYDLGYYYTFGSIGDLGQMCYKAGTAAGMEGQYQALKPAAEKKFSVFEKIGTGA